MSESLEKSFETAVTDGTLPGAVLLATNRNGTFNYSKAFGKRSLKAGDDRPLQLNDVFMLASVTKLLTTIAALKCVEQGLISLDDDVSSIIPELGNQKVFEGWSDDKKPILNTRKNPIKFRNLLTHSSGATYEFLDPRLMKYNAYRNHRQALAPLVKERFDDPLMFEPGEGWIYSTGIDWAGQVIEKVSGETLENFMRKNIWEPLDIQNITFWPKEHPEIQSRLCGMSERDATSGKVKEYTKPSFNATSKDCFGGQGAYADLTDLFKILKSLLTDDEKLLQKETTAQMFEPQLTEASKAMQAAVMQIPEVLKGFVGDFPKNVTYDWGLGGILVDSDDHDFRKKGTLIWSGLPNLFWFIDRKEGLCGILGTYVLPNGDEKVEEMIKLFERSMYELNQGRSKL